MSDHENTQPNVPEADLIARALKEAAAYHLDRWDPVEFDADEKTGRAVLDLLRSRYSDAESGLAHTEDLRLAIRRGFVMPIDGVNPASVRAFLDTHKGSESPDSRRQSAKSLGCPFLDDEGPKF